MNERINPWLLYAARAGGDYSVLTHKGPYVNLHLAYRWPYGTWLEQAGRELRDQPLFEVYLNNPREVPASELLTEICLPLIRGRNRLTKALASHVRR